MSQLHSSELTLLIITCFLAGTLPQTHSLGLVSLCAHLEKPCDHWCQGTLEAQEYHQLKEGSSVN
jgi:hypothetical protein